LNVPTILFGAVFTLASVYGLGLVVLRKVEAPPEIALAVGAAAGSVAVFLLVLAGWAGWPAFLALGILWGGLAARGGLPTRPCLRRLTTGAQDAILPYAALAIFSVYGIFYLANALAPEVWADGYTYHLAMPADYVRLGGFPLRVRFYDLIPQGIEMLFTMAFAFGRGSAAKLVEFAFFLAGVPLIFRVGARLGMKPLASLLVAVFYFTAPVIGLTGSSSYNDAALVFFTLAAFYLLLRWRESGAARYALAAGLAAGFCYAIKFPGVFTILAAAVFVASQAPPSAGRLRSLAIFAGGAAVCVAPWLLRALVVTGNPFAPMMNGLFPNPYFHLSSERELAATMRSWRGIPAWRVPWELALGGRLDGIFGPLLFLLPAGLAALRTRAGRLCVAAAAILSLAWVLNTGARFLMPAAVVGMFAAAMPLPRAALWAGIAIQALACWPQAMDRWEPAYFRLHEFPWRAALRIQPEAEYLNARVPEYAAAKMMERATPPAARIFSLTSVATAYLARDALVRWHSAEAERIFGALQMAFIRGDDWFFDWKGAWDGQPLRALRFRLPEDNRMNFDFSEVRLYSGETRVYDSPRWTLRAWPNIWDAPLAFDELRTTMWSSWQPARRGMFLEVDLDRPQFLTGVTLLSHTPLLDAPLEIFGQAPGGQWRLLDGHPRADRRPTEDLRLEATTVLRRAGFRYLLVNTADASLGPLARTLAGDAAQWGLLRVGQAGPAVLLRVW
jgi:hypothetical protein